MSDIEQVVASLECAAASGADLTAPFYAEYYARCPESRQLLAFTDNLVRGRMLEGVFELLMLGDADEQRRCIAFEVKTHRSYGARRHMYQHLFEALHQVLRQAGGAAWQPAWDDAWQARTAALLEEIEPQAAA